MVGESPPRAAGDSGALADQGKVLAMAKRVQRFRLLALVLGVALGLSACHASPDDPAGQAGELADPVRREFALGNLTRLYGKVLTDNKSDRNAGPVKQF